MLIDMQPVVGVPARSVAPRGLAAVHAPAASLKGSDLAERFCFWRGRSGRRYVFSVYRLGAGSGEAVLPHYQDAVVIAARRSADGLSAVSFGDSGGLPGLSPAMAWAAHPDRVAGDELHLHLLAGTRTERRAILDDLSGVTRRT